MNLLIQARIKKQQALGLRVKSKPSVLTPFKNVNLKVKHPSSLSKISNPVSVEDIGNKHSTQHKPKDGRWIVLQDWSSCNLKCGGGEQTLHLICMPPEEGGKPCEGPAIRKKICNTDPCPILSRPKSSKQESNKYEKPIVKVMPLSNRPTRYDKCHLKENDVFVILKTTGLNLFNEIKNQNFLNIDATEKLPARIIMNNKSISFYKDENLNSILLVLDLQSTNLIRIPNKDNCFLLHSKLFTQQAIVCNIGQKASFAAEWDYDFHLFKTQCSEKRPVLDIKSKLKSNLTNLKKDLIVDKIKKAREQIEKDEENNLKNKVDKTQAMTLLAIDKENKLEKLLEKEEAKREGEEEKELEKQLEAQQKKKEMVMQSIKEKELEEQFNISKENAENAIKKLKDEAKSVINKKRDEIKKKITQMRAKSNRKKADIKSKISALKKETAAQLQQSSKRGDFNRCFVPNPNSPGDANSKKIESKPFEDQQRHIEAVCTSAHAGNVPKFMECKLPESFCLICCESEFGQMHLSDRERCINQRCNKSI